ncbi:MAG: tRNA glutamyl-Q(34) synthetase GluQRS [Chthoniobacterales bacterium]
MTENYRGRIAPSPTGYLHVGHAATFWRAQERARAAGGELILRIEDIDAARCQPEFREALIEDLRWFGFRWKESPYLQSERRSFYLEAWKQLRDIGAIYPCTCSRKDVLSAGLAPHDENEEPIYPGTCRNRQLDFDSPAGVHWRFRIRDDEQLSFVDVRLGLQTAIAGRDFGDFIVWRRDDVPAYQLAVVVDDAAMQISEVVRGEDLLTSTFRQLLLYRSLNSQPPKFFHGPLIRDESGRRLAKRHASLSLRALRQSGATPEEIRDRFTTTAPAS